MNPKYKIRKENIMRRKLLILAVILCLIFGSMAVYGAENTPSLDGNLVLHYDFQGEDILGALKDKAPSGAKADDLRPHAGPFNFTGLTIDYENGTVKNTTNAAGLYCEVSDDTKVTSSGNATWFTRFKLQDEAPANQYFFIIEMRTFGSASNRPFGLQYNKTDKRILAAISKADAPGSANNLNSNYEYNYESAPWLNVAVVLSTVDNMYKATVYISTDLPKTTGEWTKLNEFDIGAGVAPVLEANKLQLLSNASAGCSAGITLDDLRLYNKALTLDEINAFFTEGSFVGQLKVTEPGETTATTTGVTTAKATTSAATTAAATTAEDGSKTATTSAENGKGCKSSVSPVLFAALSAGTFGTLAGFKHRRKKQDN